MCLDRKVVRTTLFKKTCVNDMDLLSVLLKLNMNKIVHRSVELKEVILGVLFFRYLYVYSCFLPCFQHTQGTEMVSISGTFSFHVHTVFDKFSNYCKRLYFHRSLTS